MLKLVLRFSTPVATAHGPRDGRPAFIGCGRGRAAAFLVTVVCLAQAVVSLVPTTARADAPRVLPADTLPDDRRLGPLTDLNGYFPMQVASSPEAWQQRAERLRRQVLVAMGLWPMPSAAPLEPVIHGRVERAGYTVEKVYFQSYPGHFVTGNLYRPTGRSGRLPGVLCPHGHWANGRFYDAGPENVRQQIVEGAERFEVGGRYPLQARCVQLARMGTVVFHYDMVGYGDSRQIAHRPGPRGAPNTAENWGYFSPQAELRLQHMMGLQTYNSVRALDFLASLPDVDPERLAVTGASGGGTQTFILCAIDERPRVAFPAVMVSTSMQGGCTCENGCYLRVGTGNIELAALCAPRPLGMTAADDWTREILSKGLPELKQHYAMLGVPDAVMARALVQFGHNYNYVSRAVMYRWLNQHLGLGLDEPIVEEDFEPLSVAQMSVWNDDHPQPPGGDKHEQALLAAITADQEQQLAALAPHDEATLAEFGRVVGGALDVLIGRGLPESGAVAWERIEEHQRDSHFEFRGLVRHAAHGEELPAVLLYPDNWNGRVLIWVDPAGKSSLWDTGGELRPEVSELLEGGVAIVAADLYMQGEFLVDGKPVERQRSVEKPLMNYAGYTYGYNHPLFAERVHDVLSLVSLVRYHERAPERVYLAGFNGAGPLVAAACAQAPGAVDRAVVDTGGFRFASLDAIDAADFLPGAVKYGDVPGMVALAAPSELLLLGESELPPLVEAAYKAAGAAERAELVSGASDESAARQAAIQWLLRP